MPDPTRSTILRHLLAEAAKDADDVGPHLIENDDLLAGWSADQLTPDEQVWLRHHLSRCAACRSELAALVRDGVVIPPLPREEVAAPRAPRSYRRARWAGLLALAAAVLLAVWLGGPKPNGESEWAAANRYFQAGEFVAAAAAAEHVLDGPAAPDRKAEAADLLARAAVAAARDDLQSRRFPAVANRVAGLRARGITSSRLEDLRLNAERGIPAETALAFAGRVTDFGYRLDGSAPFKAIPDLTLAQERWLSEYAKLVRDGTADSGVRLNYGHLLLTVGQYEAAVQQFRAVPAADPALGEAETGLGLAAFELKQLDDAARHFQEAARLRPDDPTAQINAAVGLERLNKKADARPYWERAARLVADPALRAEIEKRLQFD